MSESICSQCYGIGACMKHPVDYEDVPCLMCARGRVRPVCITCTNRLVDQLEYSEQRLRPIFGGVPRPTRDQLMDLLEKVLPLIPPDAPLRWYKNDALIDQITRIIEQRKKEKDHVEGK